jgi:hypothetical protein
MATQAASESLNTFKQVAKTTATQAASVNVFSLPGPRATVQNNTESSRGNRIAQY